MFMLYVAQTKEQLLLDRGETRGRKWKNVATQVSRSDCRQDKEEKEWANQKQRRR